MNNNVSIAARIVVVSIIDDKYFLIKTQVFSNKFFIKNKIISWKFKLILNEIIVIIG